MEFTTEEKITVEVTRVQAILTESPDGLGEDELMEAYKDKHKSSIQAFKEEFASLGAFLRYRVAATVSGNKYRKSTSQPINNTGSAAMNSVQLVSRPQFSQFFGFGDTEKGKGVPYRIWRYEVDSAVRGGLYTDGLITEQIRRSLQGEAKTKLVGLGADSQSAEILEKLDQFYSDVGAATGDEVLAEAYRFRQRENEEVAAFASRLDNHIRMAMARGTEMLPDETAVERQLRMLFWEGIRDPIKDKARHKKDACKTFAELITAARYGEKELCVQNPRGVARSHQVSFPESQESPKSKANLAEPQAPAWVAEVRSLAQEVRDFLKTNGEQKRPAQNSVPSPNRERETVCYRCGQIGHVQIGCRNTPDASAGFSGNEQRPLPRGNQRS